MYNFTNSVSDDDDYINYFNKKFKKEAQKVLTAYAVDNLTSNESKIRLNCNFPIRRKSENKSRIKR